MEKMSQSLLLINPRGTCNIYARVEVNCTLICRVVTLVRVSVTVKRHEDHGISYKGNLFIKVAALQFRHSVHYHQGSGHSTVQANMVLTAS